jgi:hypothetical protein
MKPKKLIGLCAILFSQMLAAQINEHILSHASSPAATITSSSITSPYKLDVVNPNSTSIGDGRIAAYVYLQGASSDYYVGEFHYVFTSNGVTAPVYSATPTAPTYSGLPVVATTPVYTTTQTATLPISSLCIPNGT